MIIGDFEFSFERRRYGNTTYTWAKVKYNDEWVDLGDPWPCIVPKRAELVETARERLANIDNYRR